MPKFEGGSFHGEYEDYVLSSVLDGVASGTYIDVGANHPIENSVTALFYERGWQGIVVEPQPELHTLPQDRMLKVMFSLKVLLFCDILYVTFQHNWTV
jgi:hypothetical protein